MDGQLEDVRALLRKEQLTGLSRILDRIEAGFERWQGHQEQFQTTLSTQLVDIETRYERLPSSLIKLVRKVRKQVRTSEKAELAMALCQVIAQWANAMADQIENTPEEKAKGSWFSRLFAKEAEDYRQEHSPEIQEQASYDITEAAAQPVQSSDGINLEVSKVLEALIGKLTLPNQEQPRALRLLNKVKEGLNWYELVPALEILADLVVSALGTEQEEFEAFLKSLNERLNQLQQWLAQGEALETKFSDASKDFDEKMRHHLDDLKSVLASGDTQALKGSVSKQLDDVFATLDSFKLEQRSREIAFQEHIKHLGDRLKAMESELQQAKEQLSKSQLKAMTDSLTGLPNRGAYDLVIQKEFERVKRYGGDLSLLVCDVDKFKSINDSYGHQAGDKVLQLISRQVKKGTRETDILARYGGEEFVVVLPETAAKDAFQVGEKIRKEVAKSPFHFKGTRVQITISCGIAAFKPGYRPEQVFDAADAALYKAKEGGRNQCQIGELVGAPAEDEPDADVTMDDDD